MKAGPSAGEGVGQGVSESVHNQRHHRDSPCTTCPISMYASSATVASLAEVARSCRATVMMRSAIGSTCDPSLRTTLCRAYCSVSYLLVEDGNRPDPPQSRCSSCSAARSSSRGHPCRAAGSACQSASPSSRAFPGRVATRVPSCRPQRRAPGRTGPRTQRSLHCPRWSACRVEGVGSNSECTTPAHPSHLWLVALISASSRPG